MGANRDGSRRITRSAHPVVHVSWGDAEAFARWVGKRLPSRSSEWEAAAAGASAVRANLDQLALWHCFGRGLWRRRLQVWRGADAGRRLGMDLL